MASKGTSSNEYNPTPSEEKLLEVLLDPNSLGLNITDTCAKAGVSRKVYYRAMKKKGFTKLIEDTSKELLKGKVADLFNAAYKSAISEKGYQDRKMLFTMMGLYSDKVEKTVDIKDVKGVEIELIDDDS